MKTIRFLPHFSFFSIFLLFGFWAGHRIGNSSKQTDQLRERIPTQVTLNSRTPSEATPTPVSAFKEIPPVPEIRPTEILGKEPRQADRKLPTNQRNLLVVGVDDLSSAAPLLESVWLIIYRPNTPHFMFVPIYPTPQSGQAETISENINLPKAFKLADAKELHPEFLAALTKINFLWSDYIILDKVALSDVIEFLGGAGEETGLDGVSIVADIPAVELEPQVALRHQASLVQNLCLSVTNLTFEDHWRLPLLFGLVPDHALTSLNMDDIEKEWQSQLMQIQAVKCEFPSLEGTSAHP